MIIFGIFVLGIFLGILINILIECIIECIHDNDSIGNDDTIICMCNKTLKKDKRDL